MPYCFKRSPDQANTRSQCQARNSLYPSGRPALGIVGLVPVWGFGTISNSSTFGSLVYNEVWPFVFSTLTETWTLSDGRNSTRTTVFSPYVDIYQTVTGSAIADFVVETSRTLSADETTLTINYLAVGFLGTTGVYTATVSGMFNPLSPSDGWLARTNQSLALMNKLGVNDIPNYFWEWYNLLPPAQLWGGFPIYPVSYGSGWSVGRTSYASPGKNEIDYIGTQRGEILIAAAHGMGIRCEYESGSLALTSAKTSFVASIFDEMTPTRLASLGGSFIKNHGAIISAKFGWGIDGNSQSGNPNTGNHLTVYFHELTLDPVSGVPSMGAVQTATAMPGGISNPMLPGQFVEFQPQHVINNILPSGTSPYYGVMGFRSTPDGAPALASSANFSSSSELTSQ